MSEGNPFRIGWNSTRANVVPMVVLWVVAAVLVFGYYLVPGVAGLLQPVAEWQVAWGVWAAIVNPSAYAVVGYRERRSWSVLRERAFKTLVQEAGASCEVFSCQEESAAKRAGRQADWIARLPPKCAVFAVNDNTAAEVVAACAKVGRRIPSDMTLLGFDNLEKVCEKSSPSLSGMQVDFELAGYHAAKLLDEKIDSGTVVKPLTAFGPMLDGTT